MENTLFSHGATFSPCRNYRYALWRIWEPNKPLALFVGLNPSTANETTDDPTIRKVRSIVKDWGYGGFYMMNLFAWVSKEPKDLETCPDPIGQQNNMYLQVQAGKCARVVFAWGQFEQAKKRAQEVAGLFPGGLALKVNNDGSPRHPLYTPKGLVPVLYTSKNTPL
jgi:hypothetical protein